ncbi:MAG: T9SS type A sorting domain-containing protein [Bacteroidales bacterium]|nr:T9SS type A sorting domain-containing protein [Bacteroidales bacterium]MDD4217025.1 T9SS type A sorting domain-containing protein [Bacteroidales bacterium]MDY0142310.1 T9SS type A sorting domain-containing protein [Bacteroidales bacterium]
MKNILTSIIFILAFSSLFSQEVNGLIVSSDNQFKVVKVWGTHEERGYAVGYLLADGIDDLFSNYLLPAFGSFYTTARNLMATDAHIKIDSIYIYEAMAMADGINETGLMSMEIDYIDVLLANSFLDFQNFLGKGLGLDNGCSSLISWGTATTETDLNGKSVMSRHLDWDDQPVIIRNQVMIIHFPEEENEQPWLLIGFAGQMSVLSGFNQSGVAIMQHMLSNESTGASPNKSYEPVWFSMRKAIEIDDYNNDGFNNCLDINSVINENLNGYANSYIITGVASSTNIDDDKIATIIEIAPAIPYITTRNTDYEDGIPNQNLYAANSSIARNNQLNYCTRYNAVMANIGSGTLIGTQENWELMLNYSSSCGFGGYGNIQFMQYVPENNYLKLAYHTIGGVQACENIPIVYDTQELFEMVTVVTSPKLKSKINVYPNPAATQVSVYIPDETIDEVLTVFNSSGVLVKTQIARKGENKIDISHLLPGNYFIRLRNSELKARFVIN